MFVRIRSSRTCKGALSIRSKIFRFCNWVSCVRYQDSKWDNPTINKVTFIVLSKSLYRDGSTSSNSGTSWREWLGRLSCFVGCNAKNQGSGRSLCSMWCVRHGRDWWVAQNLSSVKRFCCAHFCTGLFYSMTPNKTISQREVEAFRKGILVALDGFLC